MFFLKTFHVSKTLLLISLCLVALITSSVFIFFYSHNLHTNKTHSPSSPTANPTGGDTNAVVQTTSDNSDGKNTGLRDYLPLTTLTSTSTGGSSNSSSGSSSSSSSNSSSGSSSSSSSTPAYTNALNWFGVNISGQEFDGSFQANSQATYTYFADKGMDVVRLPFSWEELQPDLNGALSSTEKGYLDQNITWAQNEGIKVILDMHNYARRYVYRDGGFSDDFANTTQHTFTFPWADHDSDNATLTVRDFGRAKAGTINNPVSPATSYQVSFDLEVNSTDGDSFDQLYIDTFYVDDNNRYTLLVNTATHSWLFRSTVAGVKTTLASGSKTWNLNQYYHFVIDIGQATAGKINVSVDGTPLFTTDSVSTNPSLTHGYFSLNPSGVKATIKNFTMNVDGDTTDGGPVQVRVTDPLLPLSAWSDFWTKLSDAYKDNDTVIGYDQNEPHDMQIPTTPNNYSLAQATKNGVDEATTTVIEQAMLDAIRANGDDKFVIADMDHWANTHYFSTQYGTNPTPWIIDTLATPKVVYSGHYYPDSDHSGSFNDDTVPSDTTVTNEVTPFFSWCNTKNVPCYIGEYGVPNTSKWQGTLTHILELMHLYSIASTQWAGGNLYSSITTLQPTSSFTVDRLQMTTILDFLSSL